MAGCICRCVSGGLRSFYVLQFSNEYLTYVCLPALYNPNVRDFYNKVTGRGETGVLVALLKRNSSLNKIHDRLQLSV
jgi:hypothetical protein